VSGLLPLAEASKRLRGRPGRPKKELAPEEREARAEARLKLKEAVRAAVAPRLADLEGAGHYLGGISTWSVRALIASGVLPRVRLPLGGDRELRRELVDLRDCDALIEQSKERRPETGR
jgi:hypothetical protein